MLDSESFYSSSLYRGACVSQAITLGICLICVPLITLGILFAVNNLVMLATNPDPQTYNKLQIKACESYKMMLSRIFTEECLNTITVFAILNLKYENFKSLRTILIGLLALGYVLNVLGNSIKISCKFVISMLLILGRIVISTIMFVLLEISHQASIVSFVVKSLLIIYSMVDLFQIFHLSRLYKLHKDDNNPSII